jgi:hypothetical protein
MLILTGCIVPASALVVNGNNDMPVVLQPPCDNGSRALVYQEAHYTGFPSIVGKNAISSTALDA